MRYKVSLWLVLLLLITIFPLLDLFHPGLPITHDGQDHIARIANFYQNLQEGNIIPRWAGNLNWGYGHPILMFLYPLPSYFASFFHLVGFSFVDSTKLVFGLAFIASGFTMYIWMRNITGEKAALLAGVLYTIAPYRFIDLYVRGAIGEHVAFVFPPLVLYFIAKLSTKISYRYIIGGSISVALLILSHNAISIMFLPLIFFYGADIIYQSQKNELLVICYLLLFIFGLGLSSFFWAPAFFEGKYTLRDIVTAGEYSSRFVSFESFFSGGWSYGGTGQFSTQIGVVQWIVVLTSIFVTIIMYRRKNKLWIISGCACIFFVFTLFLMTESSKSIWETFTVLQKFQFPWRFLSVAVFITAALGGVVIHAMPKRFQPVVCCMLLIAILWFNKDFWHANGYLSKPDSFYTGTYDSTTDTGESSPIWSVRFMEKRPKAHIELIDGNARTQEVSRKFTEHRYIIDAIERSRIRENTLYFPGWKIFVDGKEVPIEFQDPNNRGLMTFFTQKGVHIVNISFSETKLRLFSDIVSVSSLVFLFGLGILKRKTWQHSQ